MHVCRKIKPLELNRCVDKIQYNVIIQDSELALMLIFLLTKLFSSWWLWERHWLCALLCCSAPHCRQEFGHYLPSAPVGLGWETRTSVEIPESRSSIISWILWVCKVLEEAWVPNTHLTGGIRQKNCFANHPESFVGHAASSAAVCNPN